MNNPIAPERYKKVLVIDDDEIDIFISRKILQSSFFAHEIVLKNSIADATQYLESLVRNSEELPEIIFLDLNMPGEDSFDFLEQLREVRALTGNDFRVVILTSVTDQFFNAKGKETNRSMVEAVLEKPLKADLLVKI